MSYPGESFLATWRERHPGLPDPTQGVSVDGGPSAPPGRPGPTPQALRHSGVPKPLDALGVKRKALAERIAADTEAARRRMAEEVEKRTAPPA